MATVAAAIRHVSEHAVARRPALDTFADLFNYADRLHTTDERERDRKAGLVTAEQKVEVVERRGGHSDGYFTATGSRCLDVSDFQDLGPTELLEDDGAHQALPSFFRSKRRDEMTRRVRATAKASRLWGSLDNSLN
jgi:hypothetical protein